MRRLLLALALAVTHVTFAQSGPQVPVSGSLGLPGSAPTLCSADVVFTADADLTLTANQYACNSLNVTSTVSLTATRNLIAPLTKGQQFTITNGTTGAQSIILKGATGAGVTVPTASTAIVTNPTGSAYVVAVGTSITPITGGGTGATTVTAARANLGLGSVPLPFPALPATSGYFFIDNAGNISYPSGVSPFCAGIACPNQYNTGFTTGSVLTLTSAMTTSDVTANFGSTLGFPSSGCGVWAPTLEVGCWTTNNGSALGGFTRARYGTSAVIHSIGDTFRGYVATYSISITSTPRFTLTNDGLIAYGSIVGNTSGPLFSQGIIVNGNSSMTTLSLINAIASVNNIQTAGSFGISPIVFSPARITGITAPITTPVNVRCATSSGPITCPVGRYNLGFYLNTTTLGTGTATFTATWNDGDVQTCIATLNLASTTASQGGSCPIYTLGSSDITYTVTGTFIGTLALDLTLSRTK